MLQKCIKHFIIGNGFWYIYIYIKGILFYLKQYIHPKMKNLSSFTHPYVVLSFFFRKQKGWDAWGMRGWWLWLSSSKKHIKALHHKSTIKVVQISCAIFQALWSHMIAVCKEQTKIWVSLWKSCPPPIWTCFSDICNNLNLISEALSFLRWWFNMMFLCIKFTNHFSSFVLSALFIFCFIRPCNSLSSSILSRSLR